jgi:hypothetical protein
VQLAIAKGEAGDMDAAFGHLDRALESHDPVWFMSRWRRNGTVYGRIRASVNASSVWAWL